MSYKIRIGTRKSDLALTQTGMVANTLAGLNFSSEVHHIVTTGDRDQRPFQKLIGDGFFTKEIERNLLRKTVDVAVHSAKDLPSLTHHDLPWVAYSGREDTADVLIIPKELLLNEKPVRIKDGLTIGTSSPRREFQLKKLFPTANIKSFRGNVPTRVEKVLKKEVDATVLALAGIHRLKMEDQITAQGLAIVRLPFVTAPCQGILGVQGEVEHASVLQKISNEELTQIARAEKTILALLGGGCQLAVGAKISKIDGRYHLNFDFFTAEKNISCELENENLSDLLRDLFFVITNAQATFPRVILATSLQHQLSAAAKFLKKGFQVVPWCPQIVLPTWKIKNFEDIKNNFKNFDALIFTSRFAVRLFMNDFISLYPELLSEVVQKKIYAVGKSTKKELSNYDITDVTVPAQSHGADLLKTLKTTNPLFMGSEDAIFLKLLKSDGRNYKFLELYRGFKSTGPLSDLPTLKNGDRVLLTSPKQAKYFIDSLPRKTPHIHVYAFGPSTAHVLREANIDFELNPESGEWDKLIEKMMSISPGLNQK